MDDTLHRLAHALGQRTGLSVALEWKDLAPYLAVTSHGTQGSWKVAEAPSAKHVLRDAPAQTQENVVYALPYVAPEDGKALRERGLPFVDLSGNAYLKSDGLHIQLEGGPKVERTPKLRGAAFGRKGLRVVFVLLCDPARVESPVRVLAEGAGVSHGTAQNALDDLKALGFVVDVAGRRRLTRKDELLDRWAFAYQQSLRPTLGVGRYRAVKDLRIDQHPEPSPLLWSGDLVVHHLLGTLVPTFFIGYVHPKATAWASAMRLMPDPEGPVEVLTCFWNPEALMQLGQETAFVPLPLVYADLLHQGDARSLDAAKLVKARWEG